MGIPYSKQINAAFDEVTPLVAAGFRVLRTSKNISILLAAIQILTVLQLSLILITLVALLVTVSPDLEAERKALVTPALRWLMFWLMDRNWLRVGIITILSGVAIGAFAGWYLTRDPTQAIEREALEQDEEGEPAVLES
ncbi:hypothetical protein GQ53DRAFT_817307 [Thozetella sp. PMI_491]|nr:hypothetical protein GQ53DRAFT_817307 [Thozetella sp. PMI_491]